MRKLIEAKGVIKTYVVGSTTINALNGVDFEVEEGSLSLSWARVAQARRRC